WALRALETECTAVAGAPPGTRNHRLNVAAFSLGQIIATGGLNEQDVRDRLFEAAEACGLVADDGAPQVWATIDSGVVAGSAQPRSRPQRQLQSPQVSSPQSAGASPQQSPGPQSPGPQSAPQSQSPGSQPPGPQPSPQPRARPVVRLIEGQLHRAV